MTRDHASVTVNHAPRETCQVLFTQPHKQESPDADQEIDTVNHGCCFGKIKKDYDVTGYA